MTNYPLERQGCLSLFNKLNEVGIVLLLIVI